MYITVDAKSEKIVLFGVTKGNLHHFKKFRSIIREVSGEYDIDKVYRDEAYDNKRSFNLLDDLNVEPAINIRKNAFATIRTKGGQLRRDKVLLIRKVGYDKWKQLKDARRRWIAGVVFSSIKKVLGRPTFKEIRNTESRSRTESNPLQ